MALTRRPYGEVQILAGVLLQCFVLLSLRACLGCTERSARLASTSTLRSVNDVEVPSGRELLPVRAMECTLMAMNRATPSIRLQQVRRPLKTASLGAEGQVSALLCFST